MQGSHIQAHAGLTITAQHHGMIVCNTCKCRNLQLNVLGIARVHNYVELFVLMIHPCFDPWN
jgi:hypothetical protein